MSDNFNLSIIHVHGKDIIPLLAYMRVWIGVSGNHYSLKISPIIHFIKNLGYSLK